MSRKRVRDEALSRVFSQRGSMSKLARRLGMTTQAVSLWERVPEGYIREISEFSGLAPAELRPDLATLFKEEVAA